jgi:SAM-dependent methyltransferase
MNQIARDRGWLEALREVYGEKSELYRYVTAPQRATFLDLLPLDKGSTVLEIGPGLGQFSPIIASRVKWLHALEIDAGQAEFASVRCAQHNITNASFACGGDDCRLPYLDGSFNVVIANLVFEWCGARNPDEPPQSSQKRLLAEFARVLKPGGSLWLTTKNRFAMRSLFGKPDEHAYQMRFGNALPRAIMNLMLKLRGKKYPAGVLYTHNGLARMLRDSGLDPARSFWAAPEMRYPKHFVPVDAAAIRAARKDPTLLQGESRITRLLMPRVPAGMVKCLMPGLAFIARKP